MPQEVRPDRRMAAGDREYARFCALCEESGCPAIDLTRYKIATDILSYIPERVARSSTVVPISKKDFVLTVAISDPANIFLLDNLRLVTKLDVAPVIAMKSQIAAAIERCYTMRDNASIESESESLPPVDQTETNLDLDSFKEKRFDITDIQQQSKEEAVVNAVNRILADAVAMRTSDIHVEPMEACVRVRYRVDGVLHTVRKIEKQYQEPVTARLKLMSRLDITQRRIPQDGRFGFKTRDKEMDVRVSVLPIDHGEKIVMRLLDKSNIKLEVSALGFSPYAMDAFKEVVARPFGMLLLTGPTGSGKTTTLYTLLNLMNTIERNIMTIEDPVEYNLAGVTQVPIRHEIGLGFAHILRSAMRQSPDIIMVGEIRDLETVDIALKAALTGHMVFSTLHTNDAPSAVDRMLNMGVEPFLIASALSLIAAQRLVRKVCPHCKVSYTKDLTGFAGVPEQYRKVHTFYKGEGCEKCDRSGYRGRLAVIEALVFNDEIREMVMKGASKDEISAYAQAHAGMKTLREDAMDKCMRGETTFDEVMRVTTEF
jgi:type IV pilus assembly protein PilB